VQDTVIYGGSPTVSQGSNQIYLHSNLINVNNTAYFTSNDQVGINMSTTTQSLDVSGNTQADAFLLRNSIVTMPATIAPPSAASVEMVANANNVWFYSEDGEETTNSFYLSRTNGYTWQRANVTGFSRNSVAYANNQWVAGGSKNDTTSNAIAVSVNGSNWFPAVANAFDVVNAILYHPTLNIWAAVGINTDPVNGQGFATSTDGFTWTFSGFTNRVYNDMALLPNGFLVVGQSKTLDSYTLLHYHIYCIWFLYPWLY
jgi:hypothetical protein